MEKERNAIKQDCIRMAWGMRGGMQYSDILQMSPTERKEVSNLMKENIETTKKTQLPYF